MSYLFKALLPLTVLILVSGCGQASKKRATEKASDQDVVAQDIDKLESGVRIAAANKRIDELERKVGELETTPEKLNLDLLTQRVTALEVKANGSSASNTETSIPSDQPNNGRPTSSAAQQSPATKRPPTRSSTLNLPDLEKGPRLATPTEAKAFSPGK